MIVSFKTKETKLIWEGNISKKLPINIQNIARRKLRMLNNAVILTELQIPPANKLEKLKGNLKDYYSIRINNQWRICFKWINGNVYEV